MNVRRCKYKALSWSKTVGVRRETGFAILEIQIGVGRQQPRRTKYKKDGNNKHNYDFQDLGEEFGHCKTSGEGQNSVGTQRGGLAGFLREGRRCVTT